MSTIKATVGGTEYSPVESISTGGKTVDLEAELDLEAKEITIEENGTTIVTPATGKDGMEHITVHTNVSGGGVNPLLYMNNAATELFRNKTLPNNFSVEFGESVTALGTTNKGCFNSAAPEDETVNSELTVKCNGTITNMHSCFGSSKFKKIVLDFDTSSVTYWVQIFNNCEAKDIVGLIDMTSATDVGLSFNACKVENIRFAPNTIPISIGFRYSTYMTKESVISLANGLDETATGQSLNYFASSYATKLATLGTVSMDESNTYHIFTEDADGDTTLSDFITTTKGWTIA